MVFMSYYLSPIGWLMLTSDGGSLSGLWMEGQKYFAASVKDELEEKSDLSIFSAAKEWLDSYFGGREPSISDLPLAPDGGFFRHTVWTILCEIPYGSCITYGQIAKETALRMNKSSMSSQAVGGAVGHNPISIIIPCHRVVGTNGSLTGYAGGIEKKKQLLGLEGVDLTHYFTPSRGTAL